MLRNIFRWLIFQFSHSPPKTISIPKHSSHYFSADGTVFVLYPFVPTVRSATLTEYVITNTCFFNSYETSWQLRWVWNNINTAKKCPLESVSSQLLKRGSCHVNSFSKAFTWSVSLQSQQARVSSIDDLSTTRFVFLRFYLMLWRLLRVLNSLHPKWRFDYVSASHESDYEDSINVETKSSFITFEINHIISKYYITAVHFSRKTSLDVNRQLKKHNWNLRILSER